jgi:hypothetical protein
MALLSFWIGVASIPTAMTTERALPALTTAVVAISNIVAGFALWRCLSWAHIGFIAVAIAGIVNLSMFHFVLGQPSTRVWAGQLIVAGTFSLLVYRYIRTQLSAASLGADLPNPAVQADRATRGG